jgi:hypothetical protein
MNAEVSAPAHGSGSINLDHGLGRRLRIRREPDRGAAGATPIADGPRLDAVEVGYAEQQRRH